MVSGNGQLVGDQEQFAALMALMVRSVGLPARVVVGFVPPAGTADPSGDASDGRIDIRGRDISAWVEVPFEGYGWVAFDPTPTPAESDPEPDNRSSAERRTVNADVPPAPPQAQPDSIDAQSANHGLRPRTPIPGLPTTPDCSRWSGGFCCGCCWRWPYSRCRWASCWP